MAYKKKPIDPDGIDLLGKKPAARELAKYAQQAGADALPLLERAFRSGSFDVRDAAALALATLDAHLLERLAREALAALDKRAKKKELGALLKCLALSGSPDAITDLAERARTHDLSKVLPPTLLVKLWRVVAPQLAGVDANTARVWLEGLGLLLLSVGSEYFSAHIASWATADDAMEILSGVLDSPLPDRHKAEAAKVLRTALLKSDPTHAYEVLAPRFRQDAGVRPLIAGLLDTRADARWLGEAEALLESDLRAACAALVRIGSERALALLLARAEASNGLDDATREILHALGLAGEGRVAPLLLRWLDDAQGEVFAPMLLAALGASGQASDIARIERAAIRQPARAAFFAQCIALIQARST